MTAPLHEAQRRWLTRPERSPALIVVDVQRDFGDPELLGEYELGVEELSALDTALARIGDLVDAARRHAVPVVWVELGSDPARPWRSSAWLRGGDFEAPMSASEPCIVGTPGAEWYRLTPADDELRVVKRGYSGFLGTPLEAELRAAGYDWLTVAGLTSECCVFATALDAMQLGWPVVVPRDATAAYDLAIHEEALRLMELNVAAIVGVDDVDRLWGRESA